MLPILSVLGYWVILEVQVIVITKMMGLNSACAVTFVRTDPMRITNIMLRYIVGISYSSYVRNPWPFNWYFCCTEAAISHAEGLSSHVPWSSLLNLIFGMLGGTCMATVDVANVARGPPGFF